MWNTPLKSLTFGMPWVTPQPLAEIVLAKETVVLRSLDWDKYVFRRDEIEVKPVFSIFILFAIKFVHTKEEYPKIITFGWFSEIDRRKCLAELRSIGISCKIE